MVILTMNNALSKISYFKQSSFVLVKNIRNYSSQNNKTQQQKQEPHHEKKDNFDVIINGGGIVGFSLLASLQTSPFFKEKKVLLFEQQAKANSSVKKSDVQGERQLSNRVSSLTTSSKNFFQKIRVWDDVKEFTKPIKQMYVWGNNFKNGIAFTPNGHDQDDVICYVTENNRILDSLKTIIDQFGHSVCYGTGIVDVKGEENYVNVTTNCSNNDYVNEMKTSLLIGCDGFNSIVRQKSDLKVFEHDLAQCGIVGTVTVSSDQSNLNNEIAWQRFVPFDRSVLALLPLTNECCSFVWSTSLRRANQLMELSDERFVDEMNEALFVESNQDSTLAVACDKLLNSLLSSKLLPSIQHPVVSTPQILFLDPGSRASFPLKFSTTLPYLVGSPHGFKNNRVVIIGDAAHRVHPLAGQGLNLGIGDVEVLSKHFHNHLSRGENLFADYSKNVLKKCLYDFESERQLKLIPMMGAIHSMQELFNLVPSSALSAFNQMNFIKQQIVSFANSN